MILGLNLDSIFGFGSSKPPGLQRICMILGLNLDSVFGSWSFKRKDLKNVHKCIQMSTKAFNPQCKINFGNLTFRILILQTTWFWVFLHDFGTKSRFSLGSLSSKPPGLQRICMILGLNPDSALGSLSSKPAGLQRICMILGLNLDSICGSWSFKKKDETNVYESL